MAKHMGAFTQDQTHVVASKRPLILAVLSAIVLLAFGLRLYAIRWGLPYVDHPDEPNLVNYALRALRTGDLNPHTFRKPSLYLYLLLPVLWVHYRWGIRTGLYTSLDQMHITTNLYTTVPDFFIWGRALTVVIGSLTVIVVYILATRAWNRGAGLIAALYVAVSPLLMRHSQYVTTDMVSSMFVALTFTMSLAILREGRWRGYILAGLLAGFATASKYNTAIIVAPIIAAHLIFWGRRSFTSIVRLIAAGAATIVGFLIGTPYAVLAWPEFRRGILGQVDDYASGSHGDVIGTWPIGDYAYFLWTEGLRPLVSIMVLIGLVLLLWKRPKLGLLWLSFAIPYLLLLLSQETHFMRNLLPLLVLCALPVGVGIAGLWDLKGWRSDATSAIGVDEEHQDTRTDQPRPIASRPQIIGALALTCLILADPFIGAVGLTRFEAIPDSRVRVGRYIQDNIPRGAPLAVMLHPVQWADQPFVMATENLGKHDAAWYRAQGYRYLAIDVTNTNPLVNADLHAGARVLATFPGNEDGQPGPHIELVDLGDHPNLLAIEHHEATFGDQLQLLGYQAGPGDLRSAFSPVTEQETVAPGQVLQLNLYWRSLVKMNVDYTIFLHLVDGQGQTIAQRDTIIRATDYPTSHWKPGELALDMADLPIPAGIPDGTYQLQMGIYRMETMERLGIPGTPDGTLTLTTVNIGK